MASIKTRYSDVTRTAKQDLARQADQSRGQPGHAAEERIFAKFRSRAREDFRTLSPSSKPPRS